MKPTLLLLDKLESDIKHFEEKLIRDNAIMTTVEIRQLRNNVHEMKKKSRRWRATLRRQGKLKFNLGDYYDGRGRK